MSLECRSISAPQMPRNSSRRYLSWVANRLKFKSENIVPRYSLRCHQNFDAEISQSLLLESPFCISRNSAWKFIESLPLMRVPTTFLNVRLHDWVDWQGHKIYTPRYFVCAAPFESLLMPLTRSAILQEATQLKKYQMRFREMPLYEKYFKKIRRGCLHSRNGIAIRSAAQLDSYFLNYIKLFNSIGEYGLLSKSEMQDGLDGHLYFSRLRNKVRSYFFNDIEVAIGPNGEIVALAGGKHRASIALVLDLPYAPVKVRMVHVDWLISLKKSANVSWKEAIFEGVEHLARSVEKKGD